MRNYNQPNRVQEPHINTDTDTDAHTDTHKYFGHFSVAATLPCTATDSRVGSTKVAKTPKCIPLGRVETTPPSGHCTALVCMRSEIRTHRIHDQPIHPHPSCAFECFSPPPCSAEREKY